MNPNALSERSPAPVISRRALIAAGSVLGLSVAAVGIARIRGFTPREPDASVLATRNLRFVDTADGGIDVIDADAGVLIERVHGEQGFLRGTLRGLTRERRRSGLRDATPLQLTARADGRLTLTDPATGQRIDLESFGPSNAAVYARWLDRTTHRKESP